MHLQQNIHVRTVRVGAELPDTVRRQLSSLIGGASLRNPVAEHANVRNTHVLAHVDRAPSLFQHGGKLLRVVEIDGRAERAHLDAVRLQHALRILLPSGLEKLDFVGEHFALETANLDGGKAHPSRFIQNLLKAPIRAAKRGKRKFHQKQAPLFSEIASIITAFHGRSNARFNIFL